jgi:hypothetical protein
MLKMPAKQIESRDQLPVKPTGAVEGHRHRGLPMRNGKEIRQL